MLCDNSAVYPMQAYLYGRGRVHPMNYTHGFIILMFCCGYVISLWWFHVISLPILYRVILQVLKQPYNSNNDNNGDL